MNWIITHRRHIIIIFWGLLILLMIPRLSSLTALDILSYTPPSPTLAALVLLFIYCLKSVVMVIPIVALYLVAGILFPPVRAVLLTYFCAFCEAGLGYLIGRHMGGDRVRELMASNKKAERILSFQQKNDFTTCFLARVLPVPFDLVSLYFGASGMGFGRYTVFTLLGLSPFLIPWVLAGNAIQTPLSKEFLIPFAVSILITTVVFLLFSRLQKRKDSNLLK